MLTRKATRRVLVGGALVTTLSLSSVASAYNNDTHFKITDLAWQVMRSASDRQFREHVPWTNPPDENTFDYLDEVGTCGLPAVNCPNVPSTQDAWGQYIQKLGLTMRRLNRLHNEVPTPASCIALQTPNAPQSFMQDFSWPITGAYRDEILVKGSVKSPENCDFQAAEWDGIYTNQEEAKFQFAKIVLPDDGSRLQGFAFGYHAQQRDNELQDTIMMVEPITGHILDATSEGSRFPLKVLLSVFICGYEFISNGNTDKCEDQVDHILDKIDPTNFIRSLLDGTDIGADGAYVGLWHHINVRQGVTWDDFDDKPGVYYQHAGPEGDPGVIDEAVDIGSHIMQLVLDASESYGPGRYQIDTTEDGQRATTKREIAFGQETWQSQLVGDTIFEPLDNFAQFGWAQYQADAASGKWGGAALSWPLHAIGDATVPQHVTATTSYGHRPYEEWVQHNWDSIAYERCDINKSGMPFPCNDDYFKSQIGQARRILQWGLYFTRFTANTTGVRSYIENVAEETLAYVGDSKAAWPFCDGCSFTWQMNNSDLLTQAGVAIAEIKNALGDVGISNPEAYYDPYAPKVQNLIEMAAGATIAFLMKASEGVCTDLGGGCAAGNDAACCSQKCDPTAGQCCRDRGQHCWDNTECCSGTQCNSNGVCCAQQSGATCSTDAECCQGKCNITGNNSTGTCCTAEAGQACTTNTDCCGGACVNGICCQTSLGAACGSDSACCAGPSGSKCSDSNQCCNIGSGQACGPGDVCCRGSCSGGKCCVGGGATCAADAECCNGSTCTDGRCCGGVGAFCTFAADCCSNICKNNACVQCTGVGLACSVSSDCCFGSCVAGVCQSCSSEGTACTDSSQCCSNVCFDGVCTILK